MALLPDFGAATFSDSTNVTNPYFPLPAGQINSDLAEAFDDETGEVETERSDHFATFETKTVDGVEAVVVRHTAYADDLLVEDTLDWYAQDDAGNVWYLGEMVVNYTYDDEGTFLGTDYGGSWESGIDGALPGWIMKAVPEVGDSYFQEYYPGTAVDEGEVVATGLTLVTGTGTYTDVVRILDTSALDGDEGAFKFFAPGIGQVLEEEILLANPEEPELVVELENLRTVSDDGIVDPSKLAFAGDGSEKTVTFLSEASEENCAIGAYLFDPVTGEIGEGRVLFADTEDARSGDSVAIVVPDGMSLGLFLIPDADNVGIELEDFLDGGLHFGNLHTGNHAAVYDGDPTTEFAPGTATIFDGIAPVVMDDNGNLLPIRPLHAVGNHGGYNFLNPVAGLNAREDAAGEVVDSVMVLGFEEALASTGDYAPDDFDDALLAVSDGAVGAADIAALLDAIGISRIVGTDGSDRIFGTAEDDQLIGLDGDDRLHGAEGDDTIEAGDGDDRVRGGNGDDAIEGDEGNDLLRGGEGDDGIDGGEGDDRLFGGGGEDDLQGGEGDDLLHGGDGDDVAHGGEGDDRIFGDAGDDALTGGEGDDRLRGGSGDDALSGNAGDDRLHGGAGDDVLVGGDGNDCLRGMDGNDRIDGGAGNDRMAGGDGADTFVFDLAAFGTDRIVDFEIGLDLLEISSALAGSYGELRIENVGAATEIAFGGGEVLLAGIDAGCLSADDFVFV